MDAYERVRILVLGDSGVGKTSLVHLITSGVPLTQISYTIGATVEVKLHQYREGTPNQKPYWIELFDVGGSQAHIKSRHVFYNNIAGVILVHDLSNRKSQRNLDRWLREYLDRESGNGKARESFWDDPSGSTGDLRSSGPVDVNVPLLVAGTKHDVAVAGSASLPTHQLKRSFIADEYLAEEIHLNCNDERSLVAGSTSANKLARFFDKVIEKQFYGRAKPGGGGRVSVAEGGGGGGGGGATGLTTAQDRRRVLM